VVAHETEESSIESSSGLSADLSYRKTRLDASASF
jgi:hypothetical protein